MLGSALEVLVVLVTVVISAQALFNLRLRLFIWEDPDHARLNRTPSEYRDPGLSFTILLPARNEEHVYQETIQQVYDLNYPKELMQIVAICRDDDPGTIAEALHKINELHDPSLQLLVFNDEPVNKPHGMNLALKVSWGDVVTIFDAEDEPHPDILNIVNTVMHQDDVDVVQSGVQLMNHDTRWFCVLNVLEYFFWFKSALHFFARVGMVPLGGNTVFVRRPLLQQLGGWDEHCLTEDADLGIRLSTSGARIRVVYDDAFVTREETPHSVKQLIKQRTRWNQGFVQILLKGEWLKLQQWQQRTLAFYVLIMPEVQALFALMVPVAVVMLFVHFPLWLAMFTFLPLSCLVLAIFVDLAGLRDFMGAHGLRWSWRRALVLVLSFLPYQWVLGLGALRAVYRQLRGASNWEKTAHLGHHRDPAGVDVAGGEGVSGSKSAPKVLERLIHVQAGPTATPAQVGSIRAQPAPAATTAQHARVIERLQGHFPGSAALLDEAGPDILAFASLPKDHSLQNGHNGNGRTGGGRRGRDVNGRAANPRASAWTFLTTLTRRLPTHRLTTRVASAVGTFAHAMPGGLALSHRHSLNVETIRVPLLAEVALVVAGLTGGFAAHAVNLFNYPRYELDEGTYMSSAWSILNGQITPYPYGYGHPPLAWMQIAAWAQLTGGFFTFGNALNTGRVLMLFYASGSSCLVYLIARRMSGRVTIALLATILYSFSPISIVYQRQVYLDNIGIFWLLLSLYLVVIAKSRLSYIVPAGVAFGLALLSKEIFVLFMPVMIYAVWLHSSKYLHPFGLLTFAYGAVGLGSAFVLMAVLKGELFPYPWHLPWDHHPHLSLLDTFAQQAQRTQTQGKLSDSWFTWTHADSLLIPISIVATAFNLIVGLWKRNQLVLALAAVSYWALLVRGGVVLSFYVIALIPFAALNAALAANTLMTWLRPLVRTEWVGTVLIAGLAGGVVVTDLQHTQHAFTQQPTSAQTQTMVWVRNNVPHNAVIVINSYLYMDLRVAGGEGVGDGATFPYAHVYWNMAYDPELQNGLLQNNWDRIDYIVADSEMLHDITSFGGPMLLIDRALGHSILRKEFRANENDKQIVISVYEVVHKQLPGAALGGAAAGLQAGRTG